MFFRICSEVGRLFALLTSALSIPLCVTSINQSITPKQNTSEVCHPAPALAVYIFSLGAVSALTGGNPAADHGVYWDLCARVRRSSGAVARGTMRQSIVLLAVGNLVVLGSLVLLALMICRSRAPTGATLSHDISSESFVLASSFHAPSMLVIGATTALATEYILHETVRDAQALRRNIIAWDDGMIRADPAAAFARRSLLETACSIEVASPRRCSFPAWSSAVKVALIFFEEHPAGAIADREADRFLADALYCALNTSSSIELIVLAVSVCHSHNRTAEIIDIAGRHSLVVFVTHFPCERNWASLLTGDRHWAWSTDTRNSMLLEYDSDPFAPAVRFTTCPRPSTRTFFTVLGAVLLGEIARLGARPFDSGPGSVQNIFAYGLLKGRLPIERVSTTTLCSASGRAAGAVIAAQNYSFSITLDSLALEVLNATTTSANWVCDDVLGTFQCSVAKCRAESPFITSRLVCSDVESDYLWSVMRAAHSR